MILHPEYHKEVTLYFTDEADIQPNAIDLRINSISKINPEGSCFILRENSKQHLARSAVEPMRTEHGPNMYRLEPGTYDVQFLNFVKLPIGFCGSIIPRSTLCRNGVIIQSGLYDSGYEGNIGAALHIKHESFIEANSRIAQFLLYRSETYHLYDGSYGEGKPEEKQLYE